MITELVKTTAQTEPSRTEISGKISYYTGDKTVSEVIVSIGGGETGSSTTKSGGGYKFNVDGETAYRVTPSKEIESRPRSGVTSLDLALIRRHILRTRVLDSPFKILAADVDNSGSVTSLDIALIRRVILGVTDSFPNGHWKFVRSDFEFSDPANPWLFDARRTYDALSTDAKEQNFVAIKLGDVNGSWEPPPATQIAQYEVVFDSTWSAETHPQDFPTSAHYSGLIGATHNRDIVFWNEGVQATPGICNMAETGSKSPLLSEIQAATQNLSAQQILSGDILGISPGTVSLSFSITKDYPLVTLVAMVAPSPDWFVGVHGLSLLENGGWADEKIIELFPYDAGTDSGTTYASPNLATSPHVPISRVSGSPFAVEGNIARLGTYTFTRTDPPTEPIPIPGMVRLPPGTFTMGSPSGEKGRFSEEGPLTVVTISRSFWIGRHEVTQALYEQVVGINPSTFSNKPNHPVEFVSWFDATQFCVKLTESERQAGRLPESYGYRLPTEAEWEYAARGRTTTRFSYGDDLDETFLRDYAWYSLNSDGSTHPVGEKKPNALGIYDMHGNVWEWCADWFAFSYSGGYLNDPSGPGNGLIRVLRGGSWNRSPAYCRSATRSGHPPDDRRFHIGFRFVLSRK